MFTTYKGCPVYVWWPGTTHQIIIAVAELWKTATDDQIVGQVWNKCNYSTNNIL